MKVLAGPPKHFVASSSSHTAQDHRSIPLRSVSKARAALNTETVVKFEVSKEDLAAKPIVFFGKQFISLLPRVELDKLDKIVAADPYFNGGRGQSGKTVITASVPETLELLEKYSAGNLHGGDKIEPLSADGKKALQSLVSWFVEYRNSFPDPTETGSLATNLFYLRQTLREDMRWGICVWPDPQGSGRVAAAFSGQVLVADKLTFTWGEHLFVVPELRGSKMGMRAIAGLEKQMKHEFGQTAFTLIEIDNPFAIMDASQPQNSAYFDHSNTDLREKLWTASDGPNMAMDPFKRMRFWHGLNFELLVVERKDLPETNKSVSFPYNQVPLSNGGDPCETVVLAVRIEDPDIRKALLSGKIKVKDFLSMYDAMQNTVSSNFSDHPAYKGCREEIVQHVGVQEKVRLVQFCEEGTKALNPEALEILRNTAKNKITAADYQAAFEILESERWASVPAVNTWHASQASNINHSLYGARYRPPDLGAFDLKKIKNNPID